MATKKRVPEIRFQGFSGEWEEKKLGEMSESLQYGLNAAATTFDGYNKYLRITDIDDVTREMNVIDLTTPDVNLADSEIYSLREGDILFARTGASVGKSYRYKKTDGSVYFAGFLIRARITNEFDAEFVFQNTLTGAYGKFVRITSQRSGQPGINAQEYASFGIVHPTKDEQSQIGSFFQNLDAQITLHQRKLAKLGAVKKSMLEKMFPREGAAVPEIRFQGFTGKWERKNVYEIAPLQRGFDLPKSKMSAGSYPVVMSNGINGFHSEFKVKGPGVITGRSGTIGSLHYVVENYWPHNTALWVTDFKNNDPLFVYYMFLILDLKRFGTGSGVPTLNRNDVHDQKMYVPSVPEQQKIAAFFSNLDSLITLQQRELDKLKNIKQACLAKMFV